jgi:hypothetical protein
MQTLLANSKILSLPIYQLNQIIKQFNQDIYGFEFFRYVKCITYLAWI